MTNYNKYSKKPAQPEPVAEEQVIEVVEPVTEDLIPEPEVATVITTTEEINMESSRKNVEVSGCGALRVRVTPSFDAEQVPGSPFFEGTIFVTDRQEGEWSHVTNANGVDGFALTKYLK